MLLPRQETLEILRRLISFPTVSRDSNLDLIEWTQSHLIQHGFATRLSYDDTRRKANLFASIGPEVEGGMLLSGHTDVVPVDGQDWRTDPFKVEIVDGRLYGRGACDMKGFIASVLSSVGVIDASRLRRPLHLAFTYDEEVGCKGVRTLLADLAAAGIRPSACIVGEPTEMQIVRAHKGSRNYRCCVRGKEAHASRTNEGVNAIQHAARVIGFIDEMSEQMMRSPEPDSSFETPFDTLQVSLIEGGLARNIVPRDCEFTFGYRYLPRSDPDRIFEKISQFGASDVLPRMLRNAPDASLRFEKLSDNPALSPSANAELARVAMELEGARARVLA
ncbi:acetylornithine deacetylase [Diaphorobacter aerolatus]|uniref:acetylornithine deacetylase n=1 Tax=Diaphorobacter aerolatus TaxID=1288495 RepID=UPI001D0220E7|nr:acetylornithine deacetylase [Diaphorobacter aerolatus]